MTIYEQIIAACQPYWTVRANDVHVPASYGFAQQLLAAHPHADAEIVLPAILLHDNGYANVPEETMLAGLADAPIEFKPDITRLHEIEGAKIAREILTQLDFNAAKIDTICQIIDGHDSRTEALSLEDSLVKDADKLWRYTPSAVRIAGGEWMKLPPNKFINHCAGRIETWLFTETARQIARALLPETRKAFNL